MLKMTGIKLELMTDIDMFQFIEKGLRGGISYIANRYGKANNKYMSSYNPDEPNKYIMYLDANNLYGWAMSQYLPTGGFRWLTDCFGESSNSNKTVTQLNAMTERSSLQPLPMMPSIRITSL